jgi:fatty-acyl-CoA synthase
MPVEFNLATLAGAVADRVPERAAVVQGSRTRTYRELTDRATRLARYLADRGLGAHRERAELRPHQAGQHFLAQYLHNGPEYVEGLLGAYRGRLAPFNVNYRYVAAELRYLLRDAGARAIQYHAVFAPTLAEVLPDLPPVEVLLQVDDGSGYDLLPGAVDYEQALASVPAELDVRPSPDDLYVLYTGGTTGMPKGVLWRQGTLRLRRWASATGGPAGPSGSRWRRNWPRCRPGRTGSCRWRRSCTGPRNGPPCRPCWTATPW